MKFRTKIVLGMISLMSVLFGFGSTALVSYSFQNALEQEETTAITSYRMTLTTLQILNEADNWSTEEGISRILNQLAAESSWKTIRLTADGQDLYLDGSYTESLTDLTGQADETHLAYTVIEASEDTCYLQVTGACMLGDTLAWLDIAYDITSIYDSRQLQQQTYMQIFAIMLITCAAASYLLAFFLTRPLTRLSKATRRIADGNYQYRSNIRSNDEVGHLSRDFDQMADHLAEHMDQMQNTMDQLQETMNQLQESMEQQNRFVGNFTHELKTPMTSIIGYADLLRRQNLSEEERADAANYIYKEGKRLEHLSMTLLQIFVLDNKEPNFSRISPSTQIREIARHYVKALRDQGIVLETDCQRGVCMLETDLFGSLIVNLMENARRAIHAGRKQDPDRNEQDFIRLTSQMTDTGCIISVIDNGCGIPAESLSHLTEEFYRVDKARARAQGGAGLGLSLCHRIAQLHHGTLHIESALSVGTVITVDLNAGREPGQNTGGTPS